MKQTPLDKALSTLGALGKDDLITLRGIINEILAIDFGEEFTPEPVTPDEKPRPASRARGHIELKLIRGYGPYKYLRVWRNGTLTSTYLGKAQ